MKRKRCSKCGVLKELGQFPRDKQTKDGYYFSCKECNNKQHQKHRKEHVMEVRSRERRYYGRNAEKIKETARKKRQDHPEIGAKATSKYGSTKKGKLARKRAIHKRRSHLKDTISNLTIYQWDKILSMQSNRCNICNKKFTKKRLPTIDHIIPLSRGGNLTFENIQALCLSCNSKKQAKLDTRFIQTWL